MKILVCGSTNQLMRDKVWPKIQKLIGSDATIKWAAGTANFPSEVIDGDNTYRFISYERGKEYLQGLLFDLVILDELPPEEIKHEISRRLMSH